MDYQEDLTDDDGLYNNGELPSPDVYSEENFDNSDFEDHQYTSVEETETYASDFPSEVYEIEDEYEAVDCDYLLLPGHEDSSESLCDELQDQSSHQLTFDFTQHGSIIDPVTRLMLYDAVGLRSPGRRFMIDNGSLVDSAMEIMLGEYMTNQFSGVTPKVMTRPQSALTSTGGSSDASLEGSVTFNDSLSLRETIYNDWYRTKLEQAKIKRRQQKLKEKEEAEKKEKEKQEKEREAKATYEGWKERREPFFKDKAKKKRQEEKEKEQLEAEKKEKRKMNEMAYKQWLEKRGEQIMDSMKERRKQEHKQRIEEDEEKKKKKKDSERAFESWKSKKDESLKSAHKEKKRDYKKEEETKKEKEKEKEEKAAKAFEEWEKSQREREYKKYNFQKQTEELQINRRAWRPSSRTVLERR